jgi:putative ABC transport system permease protein
VYFLIVSMIHNPGLNNVPNGEMAKVIFTIGTVVFTLFIFFFMLYINAFLIRRRKREFGLYSVLGMSKANVSHILRLETLFVVGAGVLSGFLLGAVFGRLLFMLLLNMMRATVSGSVFQLPPIGFLITIGLFLAFFIAASIYNSVHIHMTNTAELLKSDKKGEKDSRLLIPAAILGVLLLGGSYLVAHLLSQEKNSGIAMIFFFPLAFAVILATFLLFHAGSIALLRTLRKNKRFYYRAENFVSVAGMFHRMRQNARGLASICIFSTMLMVTVACTISLYLGQEDILRTRNPYDVNFTLQSDHAPFTEEDLQFVDRTIARFENQYGVTASVTQDERQMLINMNATLIWRESYLFSNGEVFLDLSGSTENGLDFSIDVLNSLRER